ncbi:hypothetical protein BSKO_01678 [Bryopsis sp. KO-2023]|nr:hypothetical protein BSKO_01678 [Bryopsis sp. KO-2023]
MNRIPPVVFGSNRLGLAEGAGEQEDIVEFLSSYADVLSRPQADTFRHCTANLLQESQRRGLWGNTALDLLQQVAMERNSFSDMEPHTFTILYRLIFFIGRDPGRKFLPIDRAIRAWEILLRGRFRLLEKFVRFVQLGTKTMIAEDTWRQVLDFSRQVREDLSNYDPSGAWPVLLDEFVDHLCRHKKRTRRRSEGGSHQDNGTGPITSIWSPSVRALSPTCGSKRCMRSVDEVAEKMSNLPMPGSSEDLDIKGRFKRLCIKSPLEEMGTVSWMRSGDVEDCSSMESMDNLIVEEQEMESRRHAADICHECAEEESYYASGESDTGTFQRKSNGGGRGKGGAAKGLNAGLMIRR